MINGTQPSKQMVLTTSDTFSGEQMVAIKSDGLAYRPTDAAGFRVVGASCSPEYRAASTLIVAEEGKTLQCKNSSTSPLTTAYIGTECYVEGTADSSDGRGYVTTVAVSTTHSVVAGIFRGFAASAPTLPIVEVGPGYGTRAFSS